MSHVDIDNTPLNISAMNQLSVIHIMLLIRTKMYASLNLFSKTITNITYILKKTYITKILVNK